MQKTHPRLEDLLSLAGGLADAADAAARSVERQVRRAFRPHRGQTLRPGADTPLWNLLAVELRAQLKHYGDKALLGRYLGLPRQRIDDFLKGKRALPDGERTLLLLVWLNARRRGIDLW